MVEQVLDSNPCLSRAIDKGQLDELKGLAATLRQNAPWPISLDDQLKATRIAFEVERQIASTTSSKISDERA